MNTNQQNQSALKSILRAASIPVLLLLVVIMLAAGLNFHGENSQVPDNGTGAEQVLIFSKKGGFYDAPFTLTLSTTSKNTIYYTLDGSDPRTSETAVEYTEGISIYDNTKEPNVYSALTEITLNGYKPPMYKVDKGIIVRAAVKNAQGEFGKVVANSYFVGKDKDYYSEMKVISMVTDSAYIFDKDTGAYMIGSKYYEWKNSDEYVKYDPGDFQNVTNYNTVGIESEFPVSIQVFEKGKAVYSTDVGARITGHWSRAHTQKSFRFYARNEYGDGQMRYDFFDDLKDANGLPIEDFDKVTLRNGGNDFQELHFRDVLIHEQTKNLECDVLASEPCVLFINGEFWGFYMIREKADGDYFESHYGIPKEDAAVIKIGGIEEGTEEDLEEFRLFCKWAATADMTDEENYKKLCESMDIQSFMDYIAVETYINNADWANGNSNNWAAWHSRTTDPKLPKADGKWRFILYDTEYSSGLYGQRETHYEYNLLGRMIVGGEDFNIPDIFRNLCKNDEFREMFFENYVRVMETCFEPKEVVAKIDEYVENYGAVIKETQNRFGLDWAAMNYEKEVEELKDFYYCRPLYAKKYLIKFCEGAY